MGSIVKPCRRREPQRIIDGVDFRRRATVRQHHEEEPRRPVGASGGLGVELTHERFQNDGAGSESEAFEQGST